MANIKDLLGEAYKEGMTSEEIVEALGDIELPQDKTDELERMKNAVSKANSEAADYKRKLKEKMSEEEKRSAEEAERISKIEAENLELRKSIKISEYTAKFLASGMDQDMACKSAEAAFNGDFDTVISNFNSRIASVKESVKAELLSSTPSLKGGKTDKVKDFTQDINGAIAVGDFANAAALMRQQQENISNTTD